MFRKLPSRYHLTSLTRSESNGAIVKVMGDEKSFKSMTVPSVTVPIPVPSVVTSVAVDDSADVETVGVSDGDPVGDSDGVAEGTGVTVTKQH